MKVKDIKKLLEWFDDDAEIIGIDWSSGIKYDVDVSFNDMDKKDNCYISFSKKEIWNMGCNLQ